MNVKFLRVLGVRSNEPAVVATVDGALVKWDQRGWVTDCDCDGDESESCPHVDAVACLLDPRVTGEEQ